MGGGCSSCVDSYRLDRLKALAIAGRSKAADWCGYVAAPPGAQMSHVVNGIWIGGIKDVKHINMAQYKIQSILNCTDKVGNIVDINRYKQLWITDGIDAWPQMEAGVEFIHENIKRGAILVHCAQGISRSVAVVMAYLIKYHKMTPVDALTLIQSVRPFAGPAPNYLESLSRYATNFL